MSKIIKTDKFKKATMQSQFSRLAEIAEKNKREIEEDPWPYIKQLQDRIVRQQKAIDSIELALRPMLKSYNELGVDDFRSMEDESFERVQNALKVIYKFRDEENR